MAKYEKLASGGNDRGKRAETAAITEDLDTGVGQVMAAIDRLGLTKNTYVIYMSDNGAGGGGGKRGGLSGGKGSVWEGGIRVPLIIRGPGIAADSWCHLPVVGYDLLPTFCEWAGIPATAIPKGVEGGSVASLLTRDGSGLVRRPREELVFHFPHYQSDDGPHSAIRIGNLKLIRFYEDDRVTLFDLSKDIGERDDLAQRLPAEAKRMQERLEKYLAEVAAQMPIPNPDFDPATPPQTREKGNKKDMKRKTKA